MNYADYIAEHVGKNIAYAEYIAQNIDKSIDYTEYLAEALDPKSDLQKLRELRVKKLLKIKKIQNEIGRAHV